VNGTRLAVPARLSQVLTAFIIECDNEFEHRMPHRTTRHGSAGELRHPPWLVSMAMCANCLRFVPADGIAAGELARRARLDGHSMDLPAVGGSGRRQRDAAALRAALAPLDEDLLRSGTAPYPDGWRAKVARPATLPHYPVISPRGGFPYGS